MFDSKSPIEVVVDRVAAAVAAAWNAARSERSAINDEEHASLLKIGDRYLSERQAALYEIERAKHLRAVQEKYRPSSHSSEKGSDEEHMKLASASVSISPLFLSVSILLFSMIIFTDEIFDVFTFKHWLTRLDLHWMSITSAGILAVAGISSNTFLHKRIDYALYGINNAPWQTFQAYSTREIEIERKQIMMMIGGDSRDEAITAIDADPDLPTARDQAVPVPPGITEYTLATGRLTVQALGDDFRQAKRQHSIVFWVSFTVFILVTVSAVTSALVLKQDLKIVGGLAVVAGVIGTYSYKMLGMARLGRIALTLFDSYVIELHQRTAELDAVADKKERDRLRNAAWTNFRSGLNHLYALERNSAASDRRSKV